MPVDNDGYPYQPVPTLVSGGFGGKPVVRVTCGGVHNLAVTEPDHTLAVSMASLVNNQMLSDVVFKIGGQPFYAHKCILKARAPLLWAEISKSEDVLEHMFAAINFEVFSDFIYFIYTADLDTFLHAVPFKSENVLKLSHLGSKYGVTCLLPACRRLIRQQLAKHGRYISPFGHEDQKDTVEDGDEGWGIFFLASGQALVLDNQAFQDTLQKGTVIDLKSNEYSPDGNW